MCAALSVCALSLIAVVWMIKTAAAVGFTVLVAPIIAAEIVLLAALHSAQSLRPAPGGASCAPTWRALQIPRWTDRDQTALLVSRVR